MSPMTQGFISVLGSGDIIFLVCTYQEMLTLYAKLKAIHGELYNGENLAYTGGIRYGSFHDEDAIRNFKMSSAFEKSNVKFLVRLGKQCLGRSIIVEYMGSTDSLPSIRDLGPMCTYYSFDELFNLNSLDVQTDLLYE